MGRFHTIDERGEWFRFTAYSHRDGIHPDITLIPVSHVAERKFYHEVEQEKRFADVLVIEGAWVPLNAVLRWLFPVLALVLGLTPQDRPRLFKRRRTRPFQRPAPDRAREYEAGGKRYVWADLDKNEMQALIAALPLSARFAYPFLLAATILILPFICSRKDMLEKAEGIEEVEGRGGTRAFNRTINAYFKIVRDARDTYLQKTLAFEIQRQDNQCKHIYVTYGALHMPKLHRLLSEDYGYHVANSREVLAVAANPHHPPSDEESGYGLAHARSLGPSMDWSAVKKALTNHKAQFEMKVSRVDAPISYGAVVKPVSNKVAKAYRAAPHQGSPKGPSGESPEDYKTAS
jgi:hypothetical protein